MALAKDFSLFGVVDLKILPITSDETGTATVYESAWIDIPGVKSLSEEPDMTTAELTGDEEVLETTDSFKKYAIKFENAYVPLSVIERINGGALTTTGTGATEKHVYAFDGDELGEYFRLAGLSKDRKTQFVYHKVRGTMTVGMAGESYATCSFSGSALRTKGTVDGVRKVKDVIRSAAVQTIGGANQVETATVAGAITTAGNAAIVVTAAGMTGTPKSFTVAVAQTDSAAVVGQKIREKLAIDAAVTALFTVGGIGEHVELTALTAAANDATLNISIDNGTCVGLTAAPTSANTVIGKVPV